MPEEDYPHDETDRHVSEHNDYPDDYEGYEDNYEDYEGGFEQHAMSDAAVALMEQQEQELEAKRYNIPSPYLSYHPLRRVI